MLYENQQIGTFNYLLGYYLGQHNYQKPFSINTYQQTYKHDQVVGDMFGNLGGKYFIVEFKKSADDCLSELSKSNRQVLLYVLEQNREMKELSKKGHFICYAKQLSICHLVQKKEYEFSDYYFHYYCNLSNHKIGKTEPIITGMEEFTMNIAFNKVPAGRSSIGMKYSELTDYLKLLKHCAGDSDYETTGTVVCFNVEEGGVTNILFQSLAELENILQPDQSKKWNLIIGNDNKIDLPEQKKNRGLLR